MSTNMVIDRGESDILTTFESAAAFVKSVDADKDNEKTKLGDRYRVCSALVNVVSVYEQDGGQYGFTKSTIARAAAKNAAGNQPSDNSSLIKDARAEQNAKKAADEEAEKKSRQELKEWNDYLRLPYTAPGMSARVVAAGARHWERMQNARRLGR